MPTSLEYAIQWVQNSISVIPCLQRSKTPALDSWREYQLRLPTYDEVGRWFARPGYNLAVITGWRGLVVIDFDDMSAIETWLHRTDHVAQMTYKVLTARGVHYYFYSAEPARRAKLGGVDVKAAGGYVLSPPSIHPCGHEYKGNTTMALIQRIPSVADILPGYKEAIEAQRQPTAARDPFDDAMSDHEATGTTIAEIKAKYSIASMLGIPQCGPRVMTRCPFHNDQHASLAVYADGHAYCFGCNQRFGDALDFYAKLHSLSIAEAMREMA